jgi:hypothetical protein
MSVTRQEIERSCIWVLGASVFASFYHFVPPVWYFFVFYFISLDNDICFISEDIGDLNRYRKWNDSSWLTSWIANTYWLCNIPCDQSNLNSVLQRGRSKLKNQLETFITCCVFNYYDPLISVIIVKISF